jgi:uncharacterized damage-inducible protein DinB
MKTRICATALAVVLIPAFAAAQGAPLAKAFHESIASAETRLVGAAEAMPGDKYSYKPTPAQMSFGAIMGHLAGGNDALCSTIGGVKPPAREKLAATATKAQLIARLKETFASCHSTLASLDDSKLGEELTVFGEKMTRGAMELETVGDWADHYSQMAIYLRMNGVLPPTAKK